MTHEEERQSQAISHTLMMAVLKKLKDLEDKIDGPQAHLSVGEAVEAFKAYLKAETKRPENYDYLLGAFVRHFTEERDLCGINAEEIEGFLTHYWHAKNTLKHRLIQINGLFKISILGQLRRDLPVFRNPCDLVKFKGTPVKSPQYVPPEALSGIFKTAPDYDILLFSIPLSAGLRISEMLKLRPMDVSGRVLTLNDPKSGQLVEYAVIPQAVADMLKRHCLLRGIPQEGKIFTMSRQGIGNIVYKWSRELGLSISVHALRKWCATFWNRAGDRDMESFVLRHHLGLRDRYVSTLTVEEAIAKQDDHLTPLFEEGGSLCRI